MLSVTIKSIMLSVTIKSIMLNVVMLNVVMLNVVMLNVLAAVFTARDCLTINKKIESEYCQ